MHVSPVTIDKPVLPERAPHLATAPSPARVLVVDDEDSLCRALTRMLTRAGYEVETARSGTSAEEALLNRHFDALVLDYRMPDTRGDVLYAIAIARQPHLTHHALFLTGDITEETEGLIAATGCTLIRKPFDNAEVIKAVASLL